MEYIIIIKDFDVLKKLNIKKEDHIYLITPKKCNFSVDNVKFILENLKGDVTIRNCNNSEINFIVGTILGAKMAEGKKVTILSKTLSLPEEYKGNSGIKVENVLSKENKDKRGRKQRDHEEVMTQEEQEVFDKTNDAIELCSLINIKNSLPKNKPLEDVVEQIALAYSSGNKESDSRKILEAAFDKVLVESIISGVRRNKAAFTSKVGDINMKLTYGLYE